MIPCFRHPRTAASLIKVLLVFLIATCGVLQAQQGQPDPAMARMREAMKKLTQRIVDAESQMVTAQAAQLAAEAQVKELTAKLEAATKELKDLTTKAAADKTAADNTIEELEKKVEVRDKALVQYTEALAKWKDGFEQAQKIANAKEGERLQAAARAIEAERKAAAHEQKNREMYRLAVEILDRYKSFGLGTALAAREPFVGSMRVKLENYLQDYGNKLDTQKIGADSRGSVEAKRD
jgi:chromosome segregation ATPase